jgi:hypothetical protein
MGGRTILNRISELYELTEFVREQCAGKGKGPICRIGLIHPIRLICDNKKQCLTRSREVHEGKKKMLEFFALGLLP